jgi:hypothetical protein
MTAPKRVTLDTNLLVERWRDQANRALVDELLAAGARAELDLAVTRHIRDDVPRDPLAGRVNELPELGVREVGGAFTIGSSTLGGGDVVVASALADFLWSPDFFDVLCGLLRDGKLRKDRTPSKTDWAYTLAHRAHGRDVFLTFDTGLLAFAPELLRRFGLLVMHPGTFLDKERQPH